MALSYAILEILLLLARDLEKRKGTLDALSFNGYLEGKGLRAR